MGIVQFTAHKPASIVSLFQFLPHRHTIVITTTAAIAFTMPMPLTSQPPIILPNIAAAPTSRTFNSTESIPLQHFSVPTCMLSPIYERSITTPISTAMHTTVHQVTLSPTFAFRSSSSPAHTSSASNLPVSAAKMQNASRKPNSSPHEYSILLTANPITPVETNTPKARMSLPVFRAVCLPPHT